MEKETISSASWRRWIIVDKCRAVIFSLSPSHFHSLSFSHTHFSLLSKRLFFLPYKPSISLITWANRSFLNKIKGLPYMVQVFQCSCICMIYINKSIFHKQKVKRNDTNKIWFFWKYSIFIINWNDFIVIQIWKNKTKIYF